MIWSYVILPKVAHVSDDPNPDKHRACPEEDAADVITCEDLKETVDVYKCDHWPEGMPLSICTL